MARIRHLERAPITEAIVDFRVRLPADFKAELFAPLKERLRDTYPVAEEGRAFKARFQFQEGKPAATDAEFMGLQAYLFKSADGHNIAQFRVDGFTYNRLAPYTRWNDVRPEALRLWELYVEVAHPLALDRLALRYINNLRLEPPGDLKRYLEVLPPQFPGMPRLLGTFLMRVSSLDPETGLAAHVTEALERAPDPATAVIILDIDVFTTTGLGLATERLLPALEALHDMKNEVFFGCITEATARLYE